MDWGHIGSGFLLVVILLITLPFLGEVEIVKSENLENLYILNDTEILQNIPDQKLEVINTETLRKVPYKDKELDNEKVIATIPVQMERPKKPSWMEYKSPSAVVRREAVPDPRFAAPEAPLICTIDKKSHMNFRVREEKAIGCCPEDDAEGTPYGPGKACCCGKIYVDNGSKFCCEETCSVMDEITENRIRCSDESSRGLFDDTTTTTTETTTTTTTSTSTTTTTTATTTTTTTSTSTTTTATSTSTTTTTENQTGSCDKLYRKKPQKMELECDADRKDGSTCVFSCPEPLRLNGTDSSTCSMGHWDVPPPSCCIRSGCPEDFKLDLYLVVDASSSIGEENFALVRRFIKSLADYFEIGQDTVRIGLISFNRKVTKILQLSDVQNKADLDAAVDSIPYNGKGTNTGRALQEVVDNAFQKVNGDRADVENQVVIITDGKSKDDIKTPGRALKKIAHVMAIGVGVKVRTKDLFEMATGNEYVYTPESYAELGKLKFEVADKHCPPGCV